MDQVTTILNTARGDVVDHSALLKAIRDKGIKAGLDVFANEPAGGDEPFDQTELASKVVCTPHIGASTEQSEEAIAEEAVRIVKEFIRVGYPPNVVNVRTAGAGSRLLIRHYNRVGVLARVLDQLRDDGINIEEMLNLIFKNGETASCSITVDRIPSESVLARIRQHPDIIEVTA